MNYETAIELAHQRMREIGKDRCEYHIDVLSLVGTVEERRAGFIKYHAYNEYLYLIDYQNYFGLMIISDSVFFNADDYTYNSKPQEFTGEILIIKIADAWSIESSGRIFGGGDISRFGGQIPVDFLRVVIH